MKFKFITLIFITYFTASYAQVGINTETPVTSLEIASNTTNPNYLDGILIPRISGSDLKNKTYTSAQNYALIYVNAPLSGANLSGQVQNVDTAGFYYLDQNTIWQKILNVATTNALINSVADVSKDAWIDNPTNTRVELGSTSTGSTRTAGTEFAILDNGAVGIGTNSPTNKLHISATSNPIKLEGLTADLAAANIVVVGTDGVLKTIPKTNITTTTVSNSSNVNQLSTTVNGVTGSGVSIINTNTLTKPATNTLRSTVNSVASTPDVAIISTVSNNSSANSMTTTVNGIAGTSVNIINTNTLTKPATNTLRSTVNSVASTPDVAIVDNVSNTVNLTNNTVSTTVNGVQGSAVTVPNIYTTDGTLASNRIVTQGANTLAFTGASNNAFSIDGTTFSVDAANDNVGIGTTTPNTSAKLEIASAGSNKGLLLPRVALTAKNSAFPLASHVKGMEVYNTATGTTISGQEVFEGKYINDGSQWIRQITTEDTRVLVGANAADFIPTTFSTNVGTATDGLVDLSSVYTFTLDKPSYVDFRGNISVALEDALGVPIIDGRTRMCIVYWTFITLPAAATSLGYVVGGQYARNTLNYSAYYVGTTGSTTHTSGNFFLNPSATYFLPIGTYSVKLTSITVSMGVAYKATYGAAAYDSASIIARSAR